MLPVYRVDWLVARSLENFIEASTSITIRCWAGAGLQSAKHLAELFTPPVHLLAGEQLHHDDLIVLNVFFEFVIDFGMKYVLPKLTENPLRLGANEKSVNRRAALE